jgi:CDP-diacylglycerol--glycerol-3-phosphate 3-phosphatidyltransferase
MSSNAVLVAGSKVVALLLFIYAGITDLIDGIIARKYNLVTNFGRLFDPLADKLINTAAFICFVELGIFSAWIVILILSREFLITGLRSLGSIQGRIIHASKWGKHKTLWQIITILAALTYLVLRDFFSISGQWANLNFMGVSVDLFCRSIVVLLMYICAIFTLLSGFIYFSVNADLIREDN